MSDDHKDISKILPDNLAVSRLCDRAAEAIRDQIRDWVMIEADSPIERLFLAALLAQFSVNSEFRNHIHFVPDYLTAQEIFDRYNDTSFPVIIETQVKIEGVRVDFLISTRRATWQGESLGIAKLIIECDGHDFHERTKDQAQRDRSRDRAFQEKGYTVFRFTGAELWRSAWECAYQVMKWVQARNYE